MVGLSLALATLGLAAQPTPGEVLSDQKISALAGGFADRPSDQAAAEDMLSVVE